MLQLNQLKISIDAKGFATIDRRFLASVGLNILEVVAKEMSKHFLISFQLVTGCCTYAIVLVQFRL